MDSSSTKHPDNIEEVDIDSTEKDYEKEEVTPTDHRGKRKDKNSPATGSNKAKWVLKARSDVWDHFDKTKESHNMCICNYCKKLFACSTTSGTSNLKKHLAVCKERQSLVEGQNNSQHVITTKGVLKITKVPESVFREACNELLMLVELPLAFIECTAWKNFCVKVNLYKPHSRRTATRDIVEMYVKKKVTLMKWLYTNKQRVSLTSDIWKAQVTGASYMVVTAHFVDTNWQLRKLILGFKYVMDHKCQTISTILLDCLAEWGIEKVFCVTLDNVSTNTSAIKLFKREFNLLSSDSIVLDGSYLHMRCSAHIINLIAREGLSKLGDNVSAICNAVQYVRSSTNMLNAFDLRFTSGKMTRGSLPLDISIRWNSILLMLNRALRFRVAFDMMEAEDKLYNDYFLELDNATKVERIGPPTSADWNGVEKLSRFLMMFYNSTLVVSSSNKVNSYKCYGEIVTIERNLSALANSVDTDLKSKATDMLDKFLKYWEGLNNVNKMLVVASIFDPRKKNELCQAVF